MPKVIIAESTANARDAMPIPPLTMVRPRGPVFSSFAVLPAATSDWKRARSVFVKPRAIRVPSSGLMCLSMLERSVSQLDNFLLGLSIDPSRRYRSANSQTVLAWRFSFLSWEGHKKIRD
jgi:hypothetical protein